MSRETLSIQETPPNHSGKEFTFGIPENGILSGVQPQVSVYAINPNAGSADISINLPSSPGISPFPIQDTVSAYGRTMYTMAQDILAPSGSSVNDRTLQLLSNLDIIVQVSNNGYLTSDGFLVYPTSSLGTSYMVVSYAESLTVAPSNMHSFQGPYQLLISTVHDNTQIILQFKFCSNSGQLVARYSDINYYCGDNLIENLDSYHNIQIQSELDLSGTLVDSDKPVAVVSGVFWGSIGSSGYPDHIADALLPIHSLGSSYAAPSAQYGDGYILRIIGITGYTTVDVKYNDGNTDTFTLRASETWTTTKNIHTYAVIEATQPVIAAQLSMYDSESSVNDPSLTILRPLCNSNSGNIALLSLPYYQSNGNMAPYPYMDITVVVAKKDLPNVRVYEMREGSGFDEYCNTVTVVPESDYLEYSVLEIPFDGTETLLIYGRHGTDMYVYTRALKWAESHSSVGGYLGGRMEDLESENIYCGQLQTDSPTTSQESTTFSSTDVAEELTSVTAKTTTPVSTTEVRSEQATNEATPTETTAIPKSTNIQTIHTPVPVKLLSTTPEFATEQTTSTEAALSTLIEGQIDNVTTSLSQSVTTEDTMRQSTKSSTETISVMTDQPDSSTDKVKIRIERPYQFKPYLLDHAKEEPVESPLSDVLGGSYCFLVLLFLVIIIMIDIPHLVAHFQMFVGNMKSMWYFMCKRESRAKKMDRYGNCY